MKKNRLSVIAVLAMTGAVTCAQGGSGSKFSAAIADRADVKQALAYVDSHFDAQVTEWIALTEIPSQSTHEQKRAAYIKGELEKLGLKPTIDGIGNVVARRPGTGGGPTI